jgi:hypothetical protein
VDDVGYDPVTILNVTEYRVTGTVLFLGGSDSCKPEAFVVQPGEKWTGGSRGGCLITTINGQVEAPGTTVNALAYESSGTAFADYCVLRIQENSFLIARRARGAEDEAPGDYEEPETPQK